MNIQNWTRGFPFVLRPSSVINAKGNPPEIWNGVDWRGLVESRPPNIRKLLREHFFSPIFFSFFKNFFFKEKKSNFLRFFKIFKIFGFFDHFWQFFWFWRFFIIDFWIFGILKDFFFLDVLDYFWIFRYFKIFKKF